MPEPSFHLIVRTPGGVILERAARSLRVPAESGQVGLRPGGEPQVLAVEPGLAIARAGPDVSYVGTAGGVLTFDGREAVLLTAFGVAGGAMEEVLTALRAALAAPSAEMEARAAIERLERGILKELREGARTGERAPVAVSLGGGG